MKHGKGFWVAGTIIFILVYSWWGISGVNAGVGKEGKKNTSTSAPVLLPERFPTTMTIEEAAQYERRVSDRPEFSATVEEDQSFIPKNVAASPAEIRNYPICPGAIWAGSTTYDYQSNGSTHRTIEWGRDPSAAGKVYVHVVWMMLESYTLNDPNRNVHYNCYDWQVPGWTQSTHSWGGMPLIEVGERSGYAHVEVNSSGNAIVYHHSAVDGATAYSRIARFSIPGMGIFTADRLTNLPGGQENVWPAGAIGKNGTADVYHVGGQDSNPAAGDPAWQAYWRYTVATGWSIPVPMCQALTLSHSLAADGNRVIFAWAKPRNLGVDRNQYDNDLAYFESLNSGADWITNGGFDEADFDAGAGWNVTSYVDPDPHRVYVDISLMFDWDGRLHALFTTPGYNDEEGTISVGPTVMQHWCEGNTPNANAIASNLPEVGFVGGQDQYHSVAAAALWGVVNADEANAGSSGAWNRYISKMTLGIGDGTTECTDPETGDPGTNYGFLYAMYTLFGGTDPLDRDDESEDGYQNANIAISMSNDNGYSWAAPKILTTVDGTFGGTPTRSPDCNCETAAPEDPECASPCRSEHWGSMAKVVNDTIHVCYIADYDAGGIPKAEGEWAVNNVVYHPVIGDRVLDGNLCPLIAPVLWSGLTGDPNCEYHGDLTPGLDPYDEETLSIYNYGNAELWYGINIVHVTGSGWMTIDGGSSIPPTTINPGEPAYEYEVVMDALETPGQGMYLAEIRITHNDPLQDNPFVISVEFFTADSFVCGAGTIMTTPCVALEVSNVESFGRERFKGGMWYYNAGNEDTLYSPIYDGSLVIANKTLTQAGPETIVYRDIFRNSTPSNPGFRALENLRLSYNAATNESVAAANQVTVDSLIGITVQYLFPQAEDSCEFVRLKYQVYSKTNQDFDLIAGVTADFDIGTVLENGVTNGDLGGYIPNYNLVYQQGTEQVVQGDDTLDVTNDLAAGITALTCTAAKRMAVQSNRNYVFYENGFTDEYIYAELDSNGVTIWFDLGEDDDNGDDYVDDIHSIIAFPEFTLVEDPYAADGGHVIHVALVSSLEGMPDVAPADYVAPYEGYVTDLINTTRKAWKKGFGWCGDFAVNAVFGEYPYIMNPDGALYLNATGIHEDGIDGGCCGCDFTLVSVTPPTATITLVDDGNCKCHLQTSETPEGNYTVVVRVEDLCGEQSEDLSLDVTVETLCDCGLWGDLNQDGIVNPLDVVSAVLCGYKWVDCDDIWPRPNCPWDVLDVNCDHSGNPLDIQCWVQYVYKNRPWCGNCPDADGNPATTDDIGCE